MNIGHALNIRMVNVYVGKYEKLYGQLDVFSLAKSIFPNTHTAHRILFLLFVHRVERRLFNRKLDKNRLSGGNFHNFK